jgi:hypothetical protein
VGTEIAFQLYANDTDAPGDQAERFQTIWYPRAEAHHDPSSMHRLRLADKPSAPVTTIAAFYEQAGRTGVRVIADQLATGGQAEILLGDTLIAKAPLVAEDGRAVAWVILPANAPGQIWSPELTSVVGTSVAGIFPLPEAGRVTGLALRCHLVGKDAERAIELDVAVAPACWQYRPRLRVTITDGVTGVVAQAEGVAGEHLRLPVPMSARGPLTVAASADFHGRVLNRAVTISDK